MSARSVSPAPGTPCAAAGRVHEVFGRPASAMRTQLQALRRLLARTVPLMAVFSSLTFVMFSG